MSEFSASDDELLSSHLDGDLTTEERARLDARLQTEPDLHARLDAFRSAAALLAAPIAPLRAGDSDRLITAAVAASTTTEVVTDLGAARMQRNKWRTRIVTVAAGVAALAIAVPVLRSVDSDNDTNDSAGPQATFSADSDDSGEDDSGDDADMAGADMADEAMESALNGMAADDGDSDDSPDSAMTDASGLAADEFDLVSRFAFFSAADPDFDPLPDDLGDFANEAALAAALVDSTTGYTIAATARSVIPVEDPDDDQGTSEEPDQPDDDSPSTAGALALLRNQAALYLDGFGGCGSAIDEIGQLLDELPPVLAVDWSLARLDDESLIVGLFRLAEDQVFAIVIDAATCTSTDQLVFP